VYTHFRVGSEETRYTLTIGGYRPGSTRDIGDGFSGHNFGHREDVFLTKHQGMAFSTFDRDNDRYLQGTYESYRLNQGCFALRAKFDYMKVPAGQHFLLIFL